MCYCYFRAAKLFSSDTIEEQLLKSLFLCSAEPSEILDALKPGWTAEVYINLDDKYSMLNVQHSMYSLFPWKEELSDGIDYEKFCESFLLQPDLFLRIRPGMKEKVLDKLNSSGLKFQLLGDNCIAVANSSKTEDILQVNNEVVIQDYSSQRIGEFLRLFKQAPPGKLWDCCAASGGKSILAKDILGDIDLTVSDVRDSILVNLRKRFKEAGILNYRSYVADLTNLSGNSSIFNHQYSIIIADVPCTGSGTWSRTPEQLYYFNQSRIKEFALLQSQIVSNVIPRLIPGGHFLYITCSVFREENENMISMLKEKFHLRLMKMELLKGYDKKADTMFAALLQKPL